jgi:heme A synthase
MKLTQRVALATCILTLILIGIGAYVRATGSGLGCPDWPTCHGGVVPPGTRHSLIEFSHRFTASLVGLLVIATAVLAWKYYRHVPFILWTATAAVPLVGFQGILGAITVKTELPPEVVATHLVIAMCVFSIEIAAFFAMYLEDPDRRERLRAIATAPTRLPGKVALIAIVWLAAVMWIGGYMAESGASTACTGWPTCNGSILPANDNHEIIHMVHRYIAGLFIFLIVPLVVIAWRRRDDLFWAKPVAVVVGVLYVLQVFVGAFNVWYTFPDWLTVAHTVIAASIWGTLSVAIVLTFYTALAEHHTHPLTSKAKVTA